MPNVNILTGIIKLNPHVFNGTEKQLIASYYNYIGMEGGTGILPLSLTLAQREFFKVAYSSKAKKYSLDWIEGLYVNGLLSCPMCGGDGPRTIEHYLPKECYPEYSVLSYNLIPSCGTCNAKRGSYNKYLQWPSLLHPYFDADIFSRLLLEVDLTIETGVPNFSMVFNSEAFTSWELSRIQAHIRICVDMPSFRSKCFGFLTEYKFAGEMYGAVAKYFKTYLPIRLKILAGGGNKNCWESALIRGVMKRPDVAEKIMKSRTY
ncbi:hypothetical protein [Pseudomonas veronii]|uniref:HNH endonuclease n=1 Tax=Pseudomonas veronii TaxID=76761 RepID=A0A4P7YAM3_PSEVE|nr:hypothetical protein [Pseudomonas veronii]QCG68121.2 hypothetical protein E4167_29505 [Pseudomonas veronii]